MESMDGFWFGSITGSNRVIRGGSWNNEARNLRSAVRNNNGPGNRNSNVGFRLSSSRQRRSFIIFVKERLGQMPDVYGRQARA